MPDTDEVFARGIAAISALTALLAKETRLIAAGHINEGLALAAEKAHLVDVLTVTMKGVHATKHDLSSLEGLRQLIEGMQETLAVNLAVLATVRSVTEGLLRDVSRRLAPPCPNAYGPGSGRTHTPSGPLVLSRAT